MIEIARALSFGARFVILDEPTAQLDAAAIERLFGRIRRLQEQGVTFLYISHHLQEIYEICDMVTVLRDARHIVTSRGRRPVARRARERDDGGDVARRPHPRGAARAARGRTAVVLRVEASPRTSATRTSSFTVRAGEVVGLAGNAGSGKVEVAERIAGLRAPTAGSVEVDGVADEAGQRAGALRAGRRPRATRSPPRRASSRSSPSPRTRR